jgi:hypothetical protein
MLEPGEMPGKHDVHECGPGGYEPAAAQVANEEIHRRARQDIARERGEVQGHDLAEHLRDEVGRVVREQ